MSAIPTQDFTKDSTRHATIDSPRLYLAFELGWSQWKLGFAAELDSKPWRRQRCQDDLLCCGRGGVVHRDANRAMVTGEHAILQRTAGARSHPATAADDWQSAWWASPTQHHPTPGPLRA